METKAGHLLFFFEELEGLKNKFIDRFNFINILSRERTESAINSGRIDTAKLIDLGKLIDYSRADEIFICGPEEMIFCVKEFFLQKRSVKNIFTLNYSPHPDKRRKGQDKKYKPLKAADRKVILP